MSQESRRESRTGLRAVGGDPHDLLYHYLMIYDSYHNHKEVMAYAVTALYLGGAAALFVGDSFWRDYDVSRLVLLICFLSLSAVIAFLFVRHQLKLRRSAGDMFKACSRLASRWLSDPPDEEALRPDETELDPVLFAGFVWPRALRMEMRAVQAERSSRWWWASNLTYAAMATSGFLVLLRIILTWRQG